MPKVMNFIVSEQSFEKFGMMVILGTTGAAMETKMNFFFTFWGINLLKKNFKPKVAGMPFPMKGMAAMMFKKKLKSFGYEDMWEMVKDGIEEGNIKLYPCSMTMDLMGVKKEQIHDFCEEPIGAAKFIEMVDDADQVISL
ncbi:MAG: DsrE/DsrF/DrsH-like family protein [Candidatus Lokiarchaeota archaeon]|nr:DsrE/DsrF/DrsH-like family protein [Candidatus Harpocratesius repetitus]